MNVLRRELFDREWVMFAPNRARVRSLTDRAAAPDERPCPFCPGATEVPDGYDVKVLPNRYPSFAADGDAPPAEDGAQPGYGHQRVFLFDERHDANLADQHPSRVRRLLAELAAVTEELYRDARIQAVLAFQNSGPVFGPSVEHPHGQVFAVPFLPHRLRVPDGPCRPCAWVRTGDGAHPVAERDGAALLCPAASRLPYEMHVVPRQHAGLLSEVEAGTLASLAELVLAGVRAADRVSGGTGAQPYMLLLCQAARATRARHHLRIEILPVGKPGGGLKYLGGLELGFGVYVNPSEPRDSAAELRAALGR